MAKIKKENNKKKRNVYDERNYEKEKEHRTCGA